jgi:hypothetical protein
MRYQLLAHALFILVSYDSPEPHFGNLYLPWCDTLKEIKLLDVQCLEHHRVPGEWDNEIKHDGFIFKDDTGRVWYNQYPRAAYGQMDDSNNWRIRPAIRLEGDTPWLSYEDVSVYLERLERAIRHIEPNFLRSNEPPLSDDQKAMLQRHYDEIAELIQKQGYQIENIPHKLEFTDGRPPEFREDFRDITITKILAAA